MMTIRNVSAGSLLTIGIEFANMITTPYMPIGLALLCGIVSTFAFAGAVSIIRSSRA